MWTRKELKQKAKAALKRNYWKTVAVCLLLVIIGGGGFSASSVNNRNVEMEDVAPLGLTVENAADEEAVNFQTSTMVIANEMGETVGETLEAIGDTFSAMPKEEQIAVYVAFFVVFLLVFVLVFAVILAVQVFLYNPIKVGASRFMIKSVEDKGKLGELAYTFDHSYKNGIKTMFMRDLFIFLWSLLFVIPGVYKKYQYAMVPYILAENPDMPYKEALKLSADMMNGHKWRTFVLDISFFPWMLLSVMTCGILELLFTMPYFELTRAALYQELSGQPKEEVTVNALE